MPALLDAFAQGTHAARPAAVPANAGYYYLETDTDGGTLFQSTGSVWVQLAGPVIASGGPVALTVVRTAVDVTLDAGHVLVVVQADSLTITAPAAADNAGLAIVVAEVPGSSWYFTLNNPDATPVVTHIAAPYNFYSDGVDWVAADY